MINSLRQNAGKQLWTPALLTNLNGWFDASDKSSVIIAGSGVDQWRDKSGNDDHFIQGTDNDRPAYGSRFLNGLPVIDFDGVSDTMLTLGGLGSNIFEVTMVTDIDSVGFSRILWGSNSGPFAYSFNTSTNLGLDAGAAMSANTPHSMNGPELHGLVVNGFGSQISTRGVIRNTANAGNGSWGVNAWLASEVGSFNYMKGAFAEIVSFAGNNGFFKQRIEGYMAWKWGLVSQLPSSHPFKNNPPYVEDA